MRFGVVVFPGSNCDRDCYHVIRNVLRQDCRFVWHQESSLQGLDAVVLPGGFSYGDYLRVGAVARFSPVMSAVAEFAQGGGLVLGICNGFQILTEAGLLPGVLMRNRSLKFICKSVTIRVESTETPWTNRYQSGQALRIPVAHGDGNFFIDSKNLSELQKNQQILFRYCSPEGEILEEWNPNGSIEAIAGICNRERNVLGMMPHPERCSESILGSEEGRILFESVVEWFRQR
ncbi:MAG: phosphoribosylformylglycinamidine synthase subunit PurQ [Deltaproteobacteria bacterium]|nr:phosphoribosylformylglycinamidine synthase subunit PurQ [Deltaproteobacteria bacterium]